MYRAWRLCEAFGNIMSVPVEREDDNSEYAQSQNFARAVAKCGYDGIQYGSALVPAGTNVVVFDPDLADIGTSHLVRVTSVTMTYEGAPSAVDFKAALKQTHDETEVELGRCLILLC